MLTRVFLLCPARRGAAALLAALAWLAAPSAASASPPDTAWIEDVHLHPAGPAELGMVYELQAGEDAVPDRHLAVVRSSTGLDRAPLDVVPSIGFQQDGVEAARIEHAGMRVRYRLAGTPGQPLAVAVIGYRVRPGADMAHQLEQTAAARYQLGPVTLGGELGLREELGGAGGSRIELRAGGAATLPLLLNYVRVGLEAFTLVPLQGARLSDLAAGDTAEDVTIYVGPSLRLHPESLWLAIGAVTGSLTGAGAPVMARATFGIQF